MSVVDPNRYAGPQERTVLLDSICDDQQGLLAAQRRLGRANTTLHNARIALIAAQEVESAAMTAHQGAAEDVARLHERLRFARACLHPIRKLSAGLLHAIFLMLYEDCQLDLLTAKRRDVIPPVDKMTITLEFEAIWRTVTLELSEDKRLVLEESFVTARIARTKHAIDVVLVLGDTSQPVGCIDSDYLTYFKYVACTSRRFICWFPDVVYLPLLNLSSLHPPPKLEEIRIEDYGRTNAQIMAYDPIVAELYFGFRSLRKLTLRVPSVTLEILQRIQERCPSLRSLRIEVWQMHRVELTAARTTWSGFRTLDLEIRCCEDGATFAVAAFDFDDIDCLILRECHRDDIDPLWMSFVRTSYSRISRLVIMNGLSSDFKRGVWPIAEFGEHLHQLQSLVLAVFPTKADWKPLARWPSVPLE